MTLSEIPSSLTADLICLRAVHYRWHLHKSQYQSQCQILRSQLGFEPVSSRPKACQGCLHYHGKAYGHLVSRILVCGFHPYG